MNNQMIRVVIADDQRLLREGLRIILEAAPDIVVVGEAEDGESAIRLAADKQPDVMLMDIRMPKRDGIAATQSIHVAQPGVSILLLTTYDMPNLVIEGLRVGASGYMLKDCSAEELRAAVRTVTRGQVLLHTASAAQLLTQLTLPQQPVSGVLGLTEREREVLHMMIPGHTNSEIATELCVSEVTIKTHINHIFSKLGARDRAHAVILAKKYSLEA